MSTQQLPGTTSGTLHVVPALAIPTFIPRDHRIARAPGGEPQGAAFASGFPQTRPLAVNTSFVPHQNARVPQSSPLPQVTAPNYPGQYRSAALPPAGVPMTRPGSLVPAFYSVSNNNT